MEKKRLSKKVVDSIVATNDGVIVWDTVIAGFAIKVGRNGKRTYFMKYRTKCGRQRKPNIGTHGSITCEQAREIACNWAAQVAAGGDPIEDRRSLRSSPNVQEMCERVIEQDTKPRLKARTLEETERLIKNVIIPKIGRLKVTAVTRAHITRLHNELAATKPQANRVLAFLSKMFNLAERWDIRPDGTNPCRHIPRYPEHPRNRFLSVAEIQRLLETLERPEFAPSSFVVFVKLALATGRRKNEILQAKWADVDFESKVLHLRDSKTGPQTVILSDLAIETLRSARRVHPTFVISGRRADAPAVGIQKWWQRVRTSAGLQNVRIHDLRHTYASLGAAQGQSLYQIGALLGHKCAQTTMRYAHHYDQALRDASNQIGRKIQSTATQN